MQTLLLSLTFIFTSFIFQVENSYKVHDLRQHLEKGAKDKDACERFVAHLARYKGKDPVVLGFTAAAQGIMAKHAWGPYAKMKYLRSSSQLFERVISQHANVPEVHFLRYSIEFFVPKYLNMSEHLAEDKKIFLKSIFEFPNSGIDAEARQIMLRFLQKHPEDLTEQEKKQLNNVKA